MKTIRLSFTVDIDPDLDTTDEIVESLENALYEGFNYDSGEITVEEVSE